MEYFEILQYSLSYTLPNNSTKYEKGTNFNDTLVYKADLFYPFVVVKHIISQNLCRVSLFQILQKNGKGASFNDTLVHNTNLFFPSFCSETHHFPFYRDGFG